MNVCEIVKSYLVEHGYDGLASDAFGCGCGLNDLFPCYDGHDSECQPAKMRVLGSDEYVGDGGPGDTVYVTVKAYTTAVDGD